jgi:hypothetical protein
MSGDKRISILSLARNWIFRVLMVEHKNNFSLSRLICELS